MPGTSASLAVIVAAVLAVSPATTPVAPAVSARPAVEVCSPNAAITIILLDPEEAVELLRMVHELLMALLAGEGDAPGSGADGSGVEACLPQAEDSGSADEPGSGSGGQRSTPPTTAEPAPPEDRGSAPPPADPSEEEPEGQARGGGAGSPGELLDLRDWYLTLPTGSDGDPEDVQQPDLQSYSNDSFRLNDEGDGVVFRANAGGVTTENSEYPRSELREMTGDQHAAWSNTSGTHTLEVREAITEVPPAKPEVVAAQIHGGDDDVLQIRLEGQTLVAQYADGEQQTVLDADYQLGTPYDLRIVAADGRITVFYDGEQKAEIEQSGSQWYWKVGAYTQSNPDKGDAADAAGEVVVYSLDIQHTGG
jgi:hypothetical protein